MSTFRFALPLLLALVAPFAFAVDALVKPVPVPDLSKLAPDKAADVRSARIAFEKDKAVTVGNDLAEVHAILGAVYARAGLYDAAAVAFEDAAALAPNDARWIYSQGIIARFQNQNDAALGYFEKALGLDKDFLPIRIVFYLSILLHMLIALYALYQRRSLRMPGSDACQLALGLILPPLLVLHVVGTAVANSLFDLHATFHRAHGQVGAVGAIEQEGDVVLLGDVAGFGHQKLLDDMALDVEAEDALGVVVGVVGGRGVFHAAGLAPATDLDLRLHHDGLADLLGDGLRALSGVGDPARCRRDIVLGEQLFRLVLEKIHGLTSVCRPIWKRAGVFRRPLAGTVS